MKRLLVLMVVFALGACRSQPVEDHPIIGFYNNGFDLRDTTQMKQVNFQIDSTIEKTTSAYILSISHYLKGYIHSQDKRYDAAFISWENAKEAYQHSDTSDWYFEINIEKNLGGIHDVFGDYQGAIEYYYRGLEMAKKYSKQEELFISANIGLSLSKLDPDTVPTIFFDVLELAEELGDKKKIIQTNMRLGNRLVDVKRWVEAESHLQYAYTSARQENEANYIAAISHNLGRCLFLQKKYNVAAPYFQESIKYEKYRFISFMDLGECYLMLGDTSKAIVSWKAAERYFEQEPNTPDNYKLFQLLAKYDTENATAYYQKYIAQNEVFLANQSNVKRSASAGMDFMQNYQKRKAEIEQERQIKQWVYLLCVVVGLFVLVWVANTRILAISKKKKKLESELKLKTIQDKLNNIEKLF